jgi:alpha-tubulin suppressor-like RCC1 family protein
MSRWAWFPAGALALLLASSCGGGYDTTQLPDYVIASPARVSTTLAVDRVGAGYDHACLLTATGEAWCWGSNADQQLGTASTVPSCDGGTVPCTPVPQAVQGGLAFQSIDGSVRHTCALAVTGEAWCWGFGLGGQLGNGGSANSAAPVPVSGGLQFTQLDVGIGGLLTCGIATDTATYCWGPGNQGGIGNGSALGSTVPLPVASAVPFVRISVGEDHACALDAAGLAYCWGRGAYGKLGKGDVGGASLVPTAVVSNGIYQDIAVGAQHSCALALDGTPWCWGLGLSGSAQSSVPVAIAGAPPLQRLNAGYALTCGLTSAGAAYCWSAGYTQTVGDGTKMPRNAPTAVAGGLVFRALSAGGLPVCGITTANELYCWGGNVHGAAGQPGIAP